MGRWHYDTKASVVDPGAHQYTIPAGAEVLAIGVLAGAVAPTYIAIGNHGPVRIPAGVAFNLSGDDLKGLLEPCDEQLYIRVTDGTESGGNAQLSFVAWAER